LGIIREIDTGVEMLLNKHDNMLAIISKIAIVIGIIPDIAP
jgi:hypothetical protein